MGSSMEAWWSEEKFVKEFITVRNEAGKAARLSRNAVVH
jgi:hypothetical protein